MRMTGLKAVEKLRMRNDDSLADQAACVFSNLLRHKSSSESNKYCFDNGGFHQMGVICK